MSEEKKYLLVAATDGEPFLTGPASIEIDRVLEQNYTGKEHLALNIALTEGAKAERERIIKNLELRHRGKCMLSTEYLWDAIGPDEDPKTSEVI